MSFIKTIKPDSKEIPKDLAQAYHNVKGGKQAHIIQVQSLHPKAMEQHYQFYQTLMFKKSPLSRRFREMIAVTVSRLNNCHY